jgi:hypothetical protein
MGYYPAQRMTFAATIIVQPKPVSPDVGFGVLACRLDRLGKARARTGGMLSPHTNRLFE